MKISGFSIIRNARKMDYPVVESIKSLLPIVDEFVLGVGQSDDGTKDLIQSINDPKIKIFDSVWDTNKTQGGLILSEKTNEALQRCENDWCIYIQGDEVFHEQDLPQLYNNLLAFQNTPEVEGLLFDYVHFYGSFSVIASARNWYRHEIRAIKKSSGAYSYRDAQGFRIDNRKLKVRKAGARVFHYGWVKPPQTMGQKNKLLSRWWHGNKKDQEFDDFSFERSYGLREYKGTHPAVMRERVSKQDWKFDFKRQWSDWKIKDLRYWSSDVFEKLFGHRIGEYKNYELLNKKRGSR